MARKQKYDYFDAFAKQVKVAIKESDLLIEAIEGFTADIDYGAFAQRSGEIEHEGDTICHETFAATASDFVTPLEREDIVSLTNFLDDITDYMQDAMKAFYMFDIKEMDPSAKDFARIINESCHALESLIADFRDFKKVRLREKIAEVNRCEEEGDLLYMRVIRRLFTAEGIDPIATFSWAEIYKYMERCCDACEHAADTVATVVLKNS